MPIDTEFMKALADALEPYIDFSINGDGWVTVDVDGLDG